jgi:hypothetical protein
MSLAEKQSKVNGKIFSLSTQNPEIRRTGAQKRLHEELGYAVTL